MYKCNVEHCRFETKHPKSLKSHMKGKKKNLMSIYSIRKKTNSIYLFCPQTNIQHWIKNALIGVKIRKLLYNVRNVAKVIRNGITSKFICNLVDQIQPSFDVIFASRYNCIFIFQAQSFTSLKKDLLRQGSGHKFMYIHILFPILGWFCQSDYPK